MSFIFFKFAVLYIGMKLENKQYLLELSRQTLEHYFNTGKKINISVGLDEELKEWAGTFVTLMIGDQLRGCVGHLQSTQSIYLDVIDNTLAAAFADDRFLPLKKDELEKINIEVSILTKSEKINYSSISDLLSQIKINKHGIIIQKDKKSATYLPQVWEEISSKEEFLSSLCLKASLPPEEWKKGSVDVWIYEVESFREKM